MAGLGPGDRRDATPRGAEREDSERGDWERASAAGIEERFLGSPLFPGRASEPSWFRPFVSKFFSLFSFATFFWSEFLATIPLSAEGEVMVGEGRREVVGGEGVRFDLGSRGGLEGRGGGPGVRGVVPQRRLCASFAGLREP